MDAEQRDRRELEYYRLAEDHLRSRAGWLLKCRTERTRELTIENPTKSLLPRWGLAWTGNSKRVLQRRYSEFIIDAPNQPRPLQLHHCFRKESIRSLRMTIEIDGSAFRCVLWYAGSGESSEVGGKYPGGPEGDIDRILDLADKIINDRWVLLRYVRWGEVGMGSGLFPITSDVLVDADGPIHPPPNYPSLQSAAEAIVYTWTGKGDRQLIAPRYAEMREQGETW